MSKRYLTYRLIELEQNLIRDIKEFVSLFRRQPTEDEIMVWTTEIYGHRLNGLYNGWAKGLIETAMAERIVQQNVQRSSFVLCTGVENNVQYNVLEDSGYHEVAGGYW